MAKNKVVYYDRVLVDLTDDTVKASSLLSGYTAHDRSGTPIKGTLIGVPASTTAPLMDGVAATGSEDAYARGDHVHPTSEPFRVKNWARSNLDIQIPCCTEDLDNTSIAKTTLTLTGQEAADYQVVGMIAYEVKSADGKRLNCWPVCQFTGNGQTELSIRWMCGGTTRKTAASINAWVLLKQRVEK